MSEVVTAGVVVAVAVLTMASIGSLVASAPLRANYVMTIKAIRWWMVPMAVVNIAATLGALALLSSMAPALWFGWWQFAGGSGNLWLGQTDNGGRWWQAAALALPIALLVLVPSLAFGEELLFRYRNESRSRRQRLNRLAAFGLCHCVFAGIPLVAGLALMVSGAYFEQVYLRTVRGLQPEIDSAKAVAPWERLPHPPTPEGPYDPEAWEQRRELVSVVEAENDRRLEEWLERQPRESQLATERADGIRMGAVARAAAAHTVSNAMLIAALLISIVAS